MTERRNEGRYLCADLVRVDWLAAKKITEQNRAFSKIFRRSEDACNWTIPFRSDQP